MFIPYPFEMELKDPGSRIDRENLATYGEEPYRVIAECQMDVGTLGREQLLDILLVPSTTDMCNKEIIVPYTFNHALGISFDEFKRDDEHHYLALYKSSIKKLPTGNKFGSRELDIL